jgi:CBS domain-containing protein
VTEPPVDCSNEQVGRADTAHLRVRDAMAAAPKTLPADSTVGELRRQFANPHVATALLVDGARFVGSVARGAMTDRVPDDAPARSLARRDGPAIGPDAPLADALALLDADGDRRLVVLDGDRLCGLLCLTRDRLGFCQS